MQLTRLFIWFKVMLKPKTHGRIVRWRSAFSLAGASANGSMDYSANLRNLGTSLSGHGDIV